MNFMGYIKWQLKTDHNLKVLNIISKIKDKSKRNLLRGYVNKTNLNKFEILKIRKGNNLSDCMMIGAAMKGEDGLLKVSDKPTSSELYILSTMIL